MFYSLRTNKITKPGAHAMYTALKSNSSVAGIRLQGNPEISAKALSGIRNAILFRPPNPSSADSSTSDEASIGEFLDGLSCITERVEQSKTNSSASAGSSSFADSSTRRSSSHTRALTHSPPATRTLSLPTSVSHGVLPLSERFAEINRSQTHSTRNSSRPLSESQTHYVRNSSSRTPTQPTRASLPQHYAIPLPGLSRPGAMPLRNHTVPLPHAAGGGFANHSRQSSIPSSASDFSQASSHFSLEKNGENNGVSYQNSPQHSSESSNISSSCSSNSSNHQDARQRSTSSMEKIDKGVDENLVRSYRAVFLLATIFSCVWYFAVACTTNYSVES